MGREKGRTEWAGSETNRSCLYDEHQGGGDSPRSHWAREAPTVALLTKWKPEEEGVRDAQPSKPCVARKVGGGEGEGR